MKTDLIYGVEDRPPFNFRFLYGCRAHRDDCQPYF